MIKINLTNLKFGQVIPEATRQVWEALWEAKEKNWNYQLLHPDFWFDSSRFVRNGNS